MDDSGAVNYHEISRLVVQNQSLRSIRMGEVLQDLARIKIPDRENHNSRMFVDLCENIHIHYREFRIVFSLDEYFEFVNILNESTKDVMNYLAQNPDYEEKKFPTTLMIAGGKERQKKLLENSPHPNESCYFANDFAIELQAESVTDEIHVHWRDYRFALPREHFKLIADAFTNANRQLEAFEQNNDYKRKAHRDRAMDDFVKERQKYSDYKTKTLDEKEISINEIKTRFDNIETEFNPDPKAISVLESHYRAGSKRIFPILLSTEKNGSHVIIDGQHRFFAAKKAGLRTINSIIADITFEESKLFRRAEGALKEFDRQTGGRYNTVAFNRRFFAYRMGKHYRDHFTKSFNPSMVNRIKKKLMVNRIKEKLKVRIINLIKKSPFIYRAIKHIYK